MARKLYDLTRTRNDGKTYVVAGLTIREVGQQIAYCAHDSLGMPRPEATELGQAAERAVTAGEPFVLDRYLFTAEHAE